MTVKMTYEAYRDKVLAGWLGKSIGGVIGAPLENHKIYRNLTRDQLWPAEIGANDDLDIQVAWLEALQERGLYLTSKDMAEFWQDRCWYNFCEYGHFLYNLERGIHPPVSGKWNNNFFWESEGCPIRSEIWGFVCPGNPELAAEFAKYDGQLDHGGNSVLIEQFLSAADAMAFVTDDLEKVLAAGLSVIPANSDPAKILARTREVCRQYPDPAKAWKILIREYGDRDASKAITNFAIVLMALFIGQKDFSEVMRICACSGWDTDCTAATAGALLGAMIGTKSLPEDWVTKLGKNLICGIEVKHNNALITDFTEDTCKIGLEISKARNKAVEITGGPEIAVRPAPKPTIEISAEYPEAPVLWNEASTSVNVVVKNSTDRAVEGQLQITAPSGVACKIKALDLKIGAGESETVNLSVKREEPDSWLPDTNLFEARWTEKGQEISKSVFGLGGARQWQVYGPYWDMWDKIRDPICPYYNENKKCHPSGADRGSDSYNHYVRLDGQYLDEARLLREDIPEELPMTIERGEDLITEAHLGGFKGQACYYLVRTFQAEKPSKGSAFIGRSGPFRAWLDGKEVGAAADLANWATMDKSIAFDLTGEPQRLVVKVVRLTDSFGFSVIPVGPWKPEPKRGVSWMVTTLKDLPSKK